MGRGNAAPLPRVWRCFFLKQLGRNPSRIGKIFKLKNSHGGDWNEWPDKELRVRQIPKAFHEYRKDELKESTKPRPIKMKKKKNVESDDAKLPKVERRRQKITQQR